MSKFVVVVLPDENKAYAAVSAIKKLHGEGTVSLYASAVVARKPDGSLDVKQAADAGPLGIAVGSLVGVLLGALGGPAGVALGIATGTVVGAVRDTMHAGVSFDYIDQIGKELQPGQYAVIAEVSEDWQMPMDAQMEALGGKVIRRARSEFVDEMVEKQTNEVRNDFAERKAARAGAKAEKAGAKLEKRMEAARADLEDAAGKARERLGQTKDELSAKIAALEEQAQKAQPDVRARIEGRATDLRGQLAAREDKLRQAFELAEQALH